MHEELQKLWKTEDNWAVWLGLGIVLLALVVYSTGGMIAGWAVKPFCAFTIGVAVNILLGFFLSTVVFSSFWSNISSLM